MSENGDEIFKFRTTGKSSSKYSDSESIFRDLKDRDPSIQHLWSHQADILRDYHKSNDRSDIALELPTGTGKTLVGLLIAEWRRLTHGERVAYLCPTRQLAHQVGAKSEEYGIPANVLVGPQDKYPPAAYAEYAGGESIAITTYSGLFNTNPRINDPQTIVLDDSHAGENYIANMWSVSISRYDHRDLFDNIILLYEKELPEYIFLDLLEDIPSLQQRRNLDLLPITRFDRHERVLTEMLDDYASRENNLVYSWDLIRGCLPACCIFFSWSEILIRPSIPPSLTHPPFANANQRVYMSATLGVGGELERITGIPSIYRIPAPVGWDRQSTGRRLIVFPDRMFNEDDYLPWLASTIDASNRCLVLTPNKFSLNQFEESMREYGVEHEILKSTAIETSLDVFVNNQKAILALTNRYDGIDLPGEACRLLVVYGLPASVNLHERFFWSKLGLSSVLRDRVRTRITQAVGRCTRSSTDYALVVMIGTDLLDFCIKRENREGLHPELRAEIEFGLANSEFEDLESLSELTELFLGRDEAWAIAEQDIASRRGELEVTTPDYLTVLRSVVDLEVQFQYDMWKHDFGGALVKATQIIDSLSGDELSAYRAIWNYFAGCAAFLQWKTTSEEELLNTASERFYTASQANRSILWFARISKELGREEDQEVQRSMSSAFASDGINQYLMNLGTTGRKFERVLGGFREQINDNAADSFDRGLSEIGTMLGFEADKPSGQGVPDSEWRLGRRFVLLFESKSEESPQGGISLRTCRQAQGHKDWHSARPVFTQNAEIFTFVVSPRCNISKAALPHTEELYYLHLDAVRELFSDAEAFLRSVRSEAPNLENDQRYKLIFNKLLEHKLTPEELISRLTTTKLQDLPQV